MIDLGFTSFDFEVNNLGMYRNIELGSNFTFGCLMRYNVLVKLQYLLLK